MPPDASPSSTEFRRAFIAVAALAMAPAVGLGIARFGYALVLPDMRAGFGWSFSEAGTPNALNAAGYLFGAIVAGRLAALIGGMRLVLLSAIVAAVSTAASALAIGLWSLSVLRFVAGASAACGVVAGGAVAIAISERLGRSGPMVVSLFYAGPPVGIAVSALVTPFALEVGWRDAWAWLGVASFVLLTPLMIPSFRAARGEKRPVGAERAPLAPMMPALIGYALFGAGYIAYMTFMIAFLRDGGADPLRESAFWCVIGLAGVAAPFVWGRALAALHNGWGMAVTMIVTCLGAAAPLISRSFAAELASGAVFGLAMFTVVASTTVFVRRSLPPASWASGVGALTIAFSLGQTIGPVLTGVVTDYTGGLDAGMALGAVLLALGALVAAFQRDRPKIVFAAGSGSQPRSQS
jgi:predicted MFS family arabinose efflux permease